MSNIIDKIKQTIGLGLNETELYSRAFEMGVLIKDYYKAATIFYHAAEKFSEKGNQVMAAQARANSLLYSYFATGDGRSLSPLIQLLSGLQQIERIGSQKETMAAGLLRVELDCRVVEETIAQAQDDIVRLRDLHKLASDKFQAIIRNPLLTYEYVRSGDGHNEKASERHFYHQGMYQYYKAMTNKDSDPATAADNLSLAREAFQHCNDQDWLHTVTRLLENWSIKRTCWLCHREMQGYEVHFSLCSARVTPYTRRVLEELNEDSSTVNLENMQIVVCAPCGSMVTFKAAEEAAKVRRELTAKLEHALDLIQALENRVSQLERRISDHESHMNRF